MDQQLPDFSQIMKIAQKVASQIEPPDELKSGKKLSEEEMTSAISKITKSVTDVVKPDMLTQGTSSKKQGKQRALSAPIKPEDSKICFDVDEPVQTKKEKKKRVIEIESDDSDEDDPIAPRTKDMAFTLSVSLEELYNGAKKKLALRRQKIEPDGSYEEEKKKLWKRKIYSFEIDLPLDKKRHYLEENIYLHIIGIYDKNPIRVKLFIFFKKSEKSA